MNEQKEAINLYWQRALTNLMIVNSINYNIANSLNDISNINSNPTKKKHFNNKRKLLIELEIKRQFIENWLNVRMGSKWSSHTLCSMCIPYNWKLDLTLTHTRARANSLSLVRLLACAHIHHIMWKSFTHVSYNLCIS